MSALRFFHLKATEAPTKYILKELIRFNVKVVLKYIDN
jgi:hypothetical protein